MAQDQATDVTQTVEFQREWAKIVAKAWADPDFRKRVEENPKAVLRERNIELPDELHLDVGDAPVDVDHIVRPLDMAVAAGVACAGSRPGTGSTSGWSACIGTPATVSACFS